MQDRQLVEGLEPADYLDDDFPDVLLFNELLLILTFTNSLKYVAIISKLHHNAVQKVINKIFS